LRVAPVCAASVVVIAVGDVLTGADAAFTLLYLVPISLAALRLGRTAGVVVASSAAGTSLAIRVSEGQAASSLAFAWNVVAELAIFLSFALVLAELAERLQVQTRIANVDAVTDLPNRHAAVRALDVAVASARASATPITLAFVDVDDFKRVNDHWGHDRGDAVLAEVARALEGAVSDTDVVARIGGDEFVLLMPQTDTRQAGVVLGRVRSALSALAEGPGRITCSVGAVTFETPPASARHAIGAADDLMYAVKRAGKARVEHHVFAAA
jgi:diguanylate cyclase (GGDEF)-like protein